MSERKPFVGGNWKMNTNRTTASDLTRGVTDGLMIMDGVEAALFPPSSRTCSPCGPSSETAAHRSTLGPRTSTTRATAPLPAKFRPPCSKTAASKLSSAATPNAATSWGEKDLELINKKLRAVLESGLNAILCVGETLEERVAGHQDIVTGRQVRTGLAEIPASMAERLTIAYEPVWAIGTGKTATPQDAQDAHVQIRALVKRMYGPDIAARMRIIYGGSLKPDISGDIFAQPDVDGGPGGRCASLNAADFVSLCKAAANAGRTKP